MKPRHLFAFFAAVCAVLPIKNTHAAELFGPGNGDVSATVTGVTQYTFRGLAQSDENPALQIGLDYAHDSGIYLGLWGSNVDFNDGDEATVETDIYGGWRTTHDKLSLDLGGIYYWYPGADSSLNYDFFEAKAALGYDFGIFSATGSLFYSPEFYLESGDSLYASADAAVPLPKDFTLKLHYGHQSIDDEAAFGSPDYGDWSAGLAYNFKGFDLSLNYYDTDLDDGTECVSGWCDQRVVFGVSYAFK